ncbi:MAG TPA: enoyl-CoA hydratase/isomerase family protein [Chloroflexota bacterium]|jgi:enoyl-CoA hydratase/carnithine racemase
MSTDVVRLDVAESVAWITLNRPERLNAMDMDWIVGLNAAVDAVGRLADIRVVVVRGAGRSFCAGLDLDMFASEGMPARFYEGQERAFRTLELMDAVTIAAIHGHCLGGGVQLAVACDIRVCSTDARLGLTAIRKGLFPGLSPQRLPRIVGMGTAARLILGGETLDAAEALRLHLADYVVPSETFERDVQRIVDIYLVAAPVAVRSAKQLMREAYTSSWEDAYARSLPLLHACLASPEVARTRAERRG